jgi:hypothetical protein
MHCIAVQCGHGLRWVASVPCLVVGPTCFLCLRKRPFIISIGSLCNDRASCASRTSGAGPVPWLKAKFLEFSFVLQLGLCVYWMEVNLKNVAAVFNSRAVWMKGFGVSTPLNEKVLSPSFFFHTKKMHTVKAKGRIFGPVDMILRLRLCS